MNAQELVDTARTLVAGDKGLLAMDESNPTCNKRLASLGIPQTEEARRAWRELIVTTPGLNPLECHECQIQVATALGVGVFVCPRHPATGYGSLVGPGRQRESGPTGPASSGQMQSGCAPWRIQRRDGKDVSITTSIQLWKSRIR
jgi:hypothetical protein